jgi:hypothetical protein
MRKVSIIKRTHQRVKDSLEEERHVRQMFKSQGHASRPWPIFLAILALVAVYLVKACAVHQQPAQATSDLEPVFSPPGGYYNRDIRLKIDLPRSGIRTQGAVIFTVDGSTPTHTTGTVYTQPILLSAATQTVNVIRARAVLPTGKLGPVVSASYFVGVRVTLPMISLIVDPADLWDPEYGIYTHPQERGTAWERPVDVTYVAQDRHSGFHVPAGVRIHGHASRDLEKKALRLYFRQTYGISQLEYPLFADSDVRSFKRLVLHNGGQDWSLPNRENWTLMRNSLVDSLALQLGRYATHSQPALLFINGESWGIYQIRERLDDHFLADHYGIESADFLKAPEHARARQTLMGDRESWDHLLQFVESHDLADPANYAYVQSQVDIANLIDYTALQIYVANVDWPFQNVHQFRPRVQGGRWQWVFWDTDHGFGLNPYGSVDSNLINHILSYNHPQTGGRDMLLLRKLLENQEFLNLFLSRTADLLNTTLASQSVTGHIDALAAELEPDILYETSRWPSPVNWATNVQGLRDFARQRPDFVRQHIVKRFDLASTAQLAFNPPASGAGRIAINGFLVQNLPWQGVYFQGTPVQIIAAPEPGYRFAGWDPPDLPQTATITLTVHAPQTIRPRFEIVQHVPRPNDVIFTGYQTDRDHPAQETWFELRVTRPGGVDLRGWRVTDNDTKTAMDEGSLIFADHPSLAHVPRGTTIRVVMATPDLRSDREETGKEDDLNTWDRKIVLHVGNGNLDTDVDPGFNLGPQDSLVLLAPGPTAALDDDQGIAFLARGTAVTPASFGVLSDGVLPQPSTVNTPPDLVSHTGG